MKKYASDAKDKVKKAGKSSAATSGKTKESTKKDTSKKDNTKKDTTKKESTKSTWGSWFVKKKDSYPKNKLNKNTSIVDRLKYFDFDSSFTKRKTYYSKMGGSGTYTGSAKQNAWMIKQMKAHGYRKGKYNLRQDELAWTQEGRKLEAIIRPSDGAILTPLKKEDSVLNAKATRALFDFVNNPSNFIQTHSAPVNNLLSSSRSAGTVNNFDNDFNIDISLSGIDNYEKFKAALQHDKNFENMVRAMTVDRMFGGSSLKKYKY